VELVTGSFKCGFGMRGPFCSGPEGSAQLLYNSRPCRNRMSICFGRGQKKKTVKILNWYLLKFKFEPGAGGSCL
jgi:hypothetical protein